MIKCLFLFVSLLSSINFLSAQQYITQIEMPGREVTKGPFFFNIKDKDSIMMLYSGSKNIFLSIGDTNFNFLKPLMSASPVEDGFEKLIDILVEQNLVSILSSDAASGEFVFTHFDIKNKKTWYETYSFIDANRLYLSSRIYKGNVQFVFWDINMNQMLVKNTNNEGTIDSSFIKLNGTDFFPYLKLYYKSKMGGSGIFSEKEEIKILNYTGAFEPGLGDLNAMLKNFFEDEWIYICRDLGKVGSFVQKVNLITGQNSQFDFTPVGIPAGSMDVSSFCFDGKFFQVISLTDRLYFRIYDINNKNVLNTFYTKSGDKEIGFLNSPAHTSGSFQIAYFSVNRNNEFDNPDKVIRKISKGKPVVSASFSPDKTSYIVTIGAVTETPSRMVVTPGGGGMTSTGGGYEEISFKTKISTKTYEHIPGDINSNEISGNAGQLKVGEGKYAKPVIKFNNEVYYGYFEKGNKKKFIILK